MRTRAAPADAGSGAENLFRVTHTEFETVRKLCLLLEDETVLKIIQILDFSYQYTSQEIAEKSGLPLETVESVLFKLMKCNFCDCGLNEKYAFGTMSYILITILCGMWLSTGEGHKTICGISRSYDSAIRSADDVEKSLEKKAKP